MHDSSGLIISCLSVAVVAVLMVSPISIGFAADYSATTVCTGNTVSSSYFIVGTFIKTHQTDIDAQDYHDPSYYAPASGVISTAENLMKYTEVNGVKTINGSFKISSDGVYLKIDDFTGDSNPVYTITQNVTVRDAVGTTLPTTSSMTLSAPGVIDGETIMTAYSELDAGKFFLINLSVYFNMVSDKDPNTGTTVYDFSSLFITVDFSSSRTLMNGVFVQADQSISISVNPNQGAQSVIDSNPPEELGDYQLEDVTDDRNYGSGGTDYQAVNISNGSSNGITNGGRANITLTLPSNTKFIVSILGGGGNNNELNITITDHQSLNHSGSVKMKDSGFVIKKGSNQLEKVSNILSPSDTKWFVSANNAIEITFTSTKSNPSADNVVVDIVICPNT